MPEGFLTVLGQNVKQLRHILPETLVALGFLFGLIVDFVVGEERRRTVGYICLVGVLAALWVSVRGMGEYVEESNRFGPYAAVADKAAQPGPGGRTKLPAIMVSHPIFSGTLARDSFGAYFRIILLLGTLVTLLIGLHARELEGKHQGEFLLLTAAACLGGMILATATSLLTIYLALEMLSIVSYAMAGYLRQDRKSAEAGIKYVIYGAMASGIMIYGMSYLYGLTGTLTLSGPDGIGEQFRRLDALASPGERGALIAVLAMVFTGFLYKIAAAPFHYWSPDVYEGAPTTATGFFSVVPKAAGFAVLLRMVTEFFPLGLRVEGGWDYRKAETVLAALAMLTMTIGNLAALGQSNAKRMLAYSSIAHAGYMLAGMSVLTGNNGAAAVLYYLLVYLFMNLGAFLVLVALENSHGCCDLSALRGAVRREPLLVVALVIFLFSLTGLPPLAGFTGKYLIILELAQRGRWGLIVFIGINSVISLYYYMRLAKAVAIDAPETALVSGASSPLVYRVLASGKVAALILLFVYFEPVMRLCRQVIEPLR